MRLLLFDIDGTLINTNGSGSAAMLSVLEAVFDRPFSRNNVPFAGRTDPLIIQDLLLANGMPVDNFPELLDKVFEAFPEHLRKVASHKSPRLLPGVLPLLEALRIDQRFTIGLLTGNNLWGAQTKLEMVGLPFDWFPYGAFGSDAFERNHLPPIALERASALYSQVYKPTDALVIGDTPADIECGHVNGIQVLAVATGWHTYEELAAHQPEYLIPDFSDLDSTLSLFDDFARQ